MTDIDLQALRRGDEIAFLKLVRAYHSSLMRLALMYSPTHELAEETVQETWIAVLRGLDGFEGRATLRTWICRILVTIARRRAAAEPKALPFCSLNDDQQDTTPTVDPDRFVRSGPNAGRWASTVSDWSTVPERRLLSNEMQQVIFEAIAELPANQRTVITLRDVEGWSSSEVSELLDIKAGNQRIMLHRARSRVRDALERYLTAGSTTTSA